MYVLDTIYESVCKCVLLQACITRESYYVCYERNR